MEDFRIFLSLLANHTDGKKKKKYDMKELNNKVNYLDLVDMCKTAHTTFKISTS